MANRVAYATALGASVALAAYVLTSRFAEGMKRTLRVKTNVKKLKGILNRYSGNPKVLLYFVAGGALSVSLPPPFFSSSLLLFPDSSLHRLFLALSPSLTNIAPSCAAR